MISIDMTYAGAAIVTPPTVGLCSADQVVLMAPFAAPWNGTGLPLAGTATPFRLRGLTGSAPGVASGAVRPSVQTTALPEAAVAGVPAEHTNSTPGDLPPEDPLSQ